MQTVGAREAQLSRARAFTELPAFCIHFKKLLARNTSYSFRTGGVINIPASRMQGGLSLRPPWKVPKSDFPEVESQQAAVQTGHCQSNWTTSDKHKPAHLPRAADWAERINQQMAVFPCFLPDPQTLLLLASLQGNGVRVCICFTTFLPNACGMLIKYWSVSFYHCWLQRNLANLSATLSVIWQNNGPVLSNIWQSQQSLCSQAEILQSSHTKVSRLKNPFHQLRPSVKSMASSPVCYIAPS